MENNSLGYAILDTGTGFTLFNKSSESDIPYGTFALSLVNNDYQQLRKSITDTIHQYFSTFFNPTDTEEFIKTLHRKIDFHISLSSKGYLHIEQAHMITELLVTEILNRIEAEHFEITDTKKCIPFIFSTSKIQDLIKNILKRTSTDLAPLMQETNTFEINSQLLYMETPVYYLSTISDYLLLDLKMYLERSPKTVKECERCNRLYLPTRKSDKYCRLPIRSNTRTCAKIMHISPNDEFAKARNKARDKQHKQIRYYINKGKYDEKFLLNMYDKWSTKCGQKCIKHKRIDDITGFKKWIGKTKFTFDTIEKEWNEYKENNG